MILRGFFFTLYWEVLTCDTVSRPRNLTLGLAVDLFHSVRSLHKGENIVYSPISVTLALGVLQLGAKGTTLEQIRKAMKFEERPGIFPGEELSALQTLSHVISASGGGKEYTLNLANALYIQEGFVMKDQYLQRNKETFNCTVKLTNFQTSESAARAINAWVESQTNGKVVNLFTRQDFNLLTRVVLVNAVYFKGTWKHKFRTELTKPMEFTKKDGSVTTVPMMSSKQGIFFNNVCYFTAADLEYQVLELPYEQDKASLILVLPKDIGGLEEVENKVTVQLLKDWLINLSEEDVELSLPRFKMEQKLDLKETLQALNITEIFENSSDLSGMADSAELHISRAIHQAFIEVNEEGSEAAAGTGIIATIMSTPHHRFVANHPFLFIIRHNLTGSILFMGRIINPEGQSLNGKDIEAL
uniref:Serpin family I member 2 n=1 Tax=Latimeria chalumnae TaxID=7897 RepID=H3AUJ8_LATCH